MLSELFTTLFMRYLPNYMGMFFKCFHHDAVSKMYPQTSDVHVCVDTTISITIYAYSIFTRCTQCYDKLCRVTPDSAQVVI